jgi:hypothetical protein
VEAGVHQLAAAMSAFDPHGSTAMPSLGSSDFPPIGTPNVPNLAASTHNYG